MEVDSKVARKTTMLIEDGWLFEGSIFQGGKRQEYHLIWVKDGKKEIFSSPRPYPDIVDRSGRIRKIP